MKNTMKVLGMLFFVMAITVSCDNDNDPKDDNLFVGQYQGAVGYTDPDSETNISTGEGQVTVAKVGDTYNFKFSDGIPSITGIKIEDNENTFLSENGAIRIDAGTLTIGYTEDGKAWTADCSR